MRLVARPSTTRCPFCHDDNVASDPACQACGARAHLVCALELGRCAACGSRRIDDWEPRAIVGADGGHVARVRVLRDDAAAGEALTLRLDLLRRRVAPGGALAGQATVTAPPGTTLGPLDLLLAGPRRGLLRRRARRAVRLLGPDAPGSWVAGVYRIAFTVPAAALPGPGALTVSARLGRAGGPLVATLEARAEPC